MIRLVDVDKLIGKLRHFKLIDRVGYFQSRNENEQLFREYANENVFSCFMFRGSFAYLTNGERLIDADELKYFEEIFPDLDEIAKESEKPGLYASDTKAVVKNLTGRDLKEEIKEQDEQIKRLESENEQLTAENAKLTAELNQCYGLGSVQNAIKANLAAMGMGKK